VLLKIIKANFSSLPVKQNDWILQSNGRFEQRKKQHDFGLIDAIILVKQQEFHGKIVTSDKHFNNLKNVIYLH
jgi:predicted nucleic acid-binding protein